MDLLSAIRERDREALAALVADDVVLYSPATTYRGRE
jgi:ketosteroid isomerase-like protein